MIQVMPGTKVYLACRPVSMRYGFDGLAAQVKQVLASDPFSGHLFLFRSKRADYLKILYYDETGLCLVCQVPGFTLNPFPFGRIIFGEVACWSAAARSTRRFHRLHCLTGVCATAGNVQVTIAIARVLSDEAVVRPPDQRAFTDVEF